MLSYLLTLLLLDHKTYFPTSLVDCSCHTTSSQNQIMSFSNSEWMDQLAMIVDTSHEHIRLTWMIMWWSDDQNQLNDLPLRLVYFNLRVHNNQTQHNTEAGKHLTSSVTFRNSTDLSVMQLPVDLWWSVPCYFQFKICTESEWHDS